LKALRDDVLDLITNCDRVLIHDLLRYLRQKGNVTGGEILSLPGGDRGEGYLWKEMSVSIG
jgi:hypothetical protein